MTTTTTAPAVTAGDPTWPDILTTLLAREDLDAETTTWAFDQVMSGDASPSQLAGFLVALRAKGESVSEVRALADVMLRHAHRFTVPGPSLDIVGTGGDRLHSVNISTMSAIVIAASGLTVVKHGNRAASSSSGAADVLESLGVDLTLTPDQVRRVVELAGITFCFAQAFHPSMRHAGVTRRELGISTVFNMLGPITNPAQPTYAAVGAADSRVATLLAGVFADRGKDAVVFRGEDGLDELTLAGASDLWWVGAGRITRHTLRPTDVGLALAPLDALRGGDPAFNAHVVRRVLAGEVGAPRDAVLLNAGAALALAASAERFATSDVRTDAVVEAVAAGVETARATIDSGAAEATLRAWVEATHSVG